MRAFRKERAEEQKSFPGLRTGKEKSRSSSRDGTSLTSAKKTAGNNDTSCHACGAHFGFLHRKHDCRQCGRHFCSACSDNLILTPAGIPVRACDACREKHDDKRQQEHVHKKMSREEEEDALITELVDEVGEGAKVEWAKLPAGKERRMARETELTQEAFSLLEAKWEGGRKLVLERKTNGGVTDGGVAKADTEGASQVVLPDAEVAKALRDQAQKLRVTCVKFREAGMSEAATKAFRKAKELLKQAEVLEHPPLPPPPSPPPPPPATSDPKASKGWKEKKQGGEWQGRGVVKKDDDEDVMKSLRELGWSEEKGEGKGGRVGQLEAQAKAHRRAALQFKKEGKRVEALEELRKAKALDMQAEEAELLGDDADEDDLILGEAEEDDGDADLKRLMEEHEREEAARARRGVGGKDDGGGGGLDMSILAALGSNDDDGDGEEVEVGDADLHDPVMNAMLQEMGWKQEGEEGGQAAKSELGSARLAGLKAAAVGFAETKAQLQEDIAAGKRRAGMLKREGKLQEAVVELRKAKATEKELNGMEASVVAGAGQGADGDSRQSARGRSDGPLDMSVIHKLMAGGEEEEEEEVEVTEEDEDDPDMKAALQAMGFAEEPPEGPKGLSEGNGRKEQPQVSPPLPASLAVTRGQGGGMRNLEREAMALKREAVALKRVGDLRGASEKLRQAKGLEKQAEEERAMRVAMEGKEEEEEEVEVTEADENDPAMMAALSAMGWEEGKAPGLGAEPAWDQGPSSSESLGVGRVREGMRNGLEESETVRTAEVADVIQRSEVGAGYGGGGSLEVESRQEAQGPRGRHAEGWEGGLRNEMNGGGARSRPPPVRDEPSAAVHKDVPRGMEGTSEGRVVDSALMADGVSVRGSGRAEAIETGSGLQNRQGVEPNVTPPPVGDIIVPSPGAGWAQKTEEASRSYGSGGGLGGVGSSIGQRVGGDKEQPVGAAGSGRDGELQLEGQAGPSLEDMSAEIMGHKRRALALKREGRLQEARQVLAVARQLEGQVASRQASPQRGKEEGGVLGMAAVPPSPPPVSVPLTSSAPREEAGVEKQIMDLKRKALALKREGRLEEAVQALKQAKALEGGGSRKEADAPMPVTAKPQIKTAAATSRRPPPRPAVVVDDDDDDLDEDEARLDALLFGNLQSLGLMAGGGKGGTPAPAAPARAKAAAAPTGPAASSKAWEEASLSAADRRKVEDQIKNFKVRAVQMKRAGNNAEAIDALRSAKRLEAQLASLK